MHFDWFFGFRHMELCPTFLVFLAFLRIAFVLVVVSLPLS